MKKIAIISAIAGSLITIFCFHAYMVYQVRALVYSQQNYIYGESGLSKDLTLFVQKMIDDNNKTLPVSDPIKK